MAAASRVLPRATSSTPRTSTSALQSAVKAESLRDVGGSPQLTLLRFITEQADDSSGSISGQCERAADAQLGQRARSGCGVHTGQAGVPTMSPPLN